MFHNSLWRFFKEYLIRVYIT